MPPDSSLHVLVDSLGADVELLDLLARELGECATLQVADANERRRLAAVEHEVLGDRELADQSVFGAVFGHEADARLEDLAHAFADELGAVEHGRSLHVMRQPQQRLGELGLAVALHAGDGQDLAAPHREAHVVDDELPDGVDDRQVIDDEGVVAERGLVLVHGELDRATDHERGELGVRRGGLGLADDLAEADHGDAIGDLAHLAQLVGDEHDRRARVAELAHDDHQLVGLLRREHRGRLVEDEHFASREQRLDDLDPLLHPDRKVFDERVGVDVEAEPRGRSRAPSPAPAAGRAGRRPSWTRCRA